ncbi:unnamed protein product [Oppiella nova]|uniref:Uncharacterized protein n=1 Tax=Oppiella nova TaxID=334625 RepID=A0A7R9QUT4_9ACAR|nr:unnamed protein product [Oppiella nova]CAG2174813.1 unnamed protein product [Oppiella nova]
MLIENDVEPKMNYAVKKGLNLIIPNSGDIIEGVTGLVNTAKDALSDRQSADGQVTAVKERVDGHIAIIKRTFKYILGRIEMLVPAII